MEIQFDVPLAVIIGMLVSIVLPLLVGLVTTRVTSAGIKAVLLAALASVTGLLTELGNSLAQGAPFNLGVALVLALGSFLIAVGLHFGLWKPTEVADKAQSVLVTDNGNGNPA
jgi:hypothetical protein